MISKHFGKFSNAFRDEAFCGWEINQLVPDIDVAGSASNGDLSWKQAYAQIIASKTNVNYLRSGGFASDLHHDAAVREW